MTLLSSADFIQNHFLGEKFFIRVSNSLDPDQARQFVWPDLGPNCLLMLSAEKKSPLAGKELRRLYSNALAF